MVRRSLPTLVSLPVAAFLWAGCSDDSPASSSAVSSQLTAPSATTAAETASTDVQPLTCDQLEKVSVRFSDPGFSDGNNVGMYVSYLGAPPGDKFLRIWWDYINDSHTTQIVDTQAGQVRRDDPNTYDIIELVEHEYDLSGSTEITTRVELILEGTTRGCARIRTVIAGEGGQTVIRRVVSGSTPPEPVTLSFRPVDTANVERTQVTVKVTAMGSSSAQMQVGLTRNGACCDWRAPFQIFAADGTEKTFRFTADVNFRPDGATIGFSGVESADFWIEAKFFLEEE